MALTVGALTGALCAASFIVGFVTARDDRAKPAEVTTQSGAGVTCPEPFKDIGGGWSCKGGDVYVPMNAIKTFKRACDRPCDEAVR